MTFKTYVRISEIHEYASKQIETLKYHLHKPTLTSPKLTYKEKAYNARINGQIMAWEHVLQTEWLTDEQYEAQFPPKTPRNIGDRIRAARQDAQNKDKMSNTNFSIGDRVRVVDQGITGTVVRYDSGNKLVVLDDDRDAWAEEGEEGVLVFRADELTKENENAE